MQPQKLDPQIVTLTKAIRQVESGGNFQATGKSGEYGAYQFTPDTWNNLSQKYIGKKIPLQQATPEQQNQAAYSQIAEWKKAGYNVGQIASMWNAGQGEPDAYTGTFSNGKPSIGVNKFGVKYSVPDYAKSVATAYQQLKVGQQVGIDPNNPSSVGGEQMVQPSNPSGVMFPSSPNDSASTAGLKAIGNLPGSAMNFAIGAAKSLNPLQTLDTIGQTASAFSELASQQGAAKTLWDTIVGLPKAAYETLVPQGVQSLLKGDTQGASEAFTNDPFGQVAPLVLAGEGVARVADRFLPASEALKSRTPMIAGPDGIKVADNPYSQMFDRGIQKIASPITDTASSVASKISAGANTLVSHITTLPPDSITTAINNPKILSKINKELVNRPAIQEEFKMAVDNFIEGKKVTGEAYQPIRESGAQIAVPENWLSETLARHGLKIEPVTAEGKPTIYKVIADSKSITRDPRDIRALQNFVNNWNGKTTLTADELLNMRSDAQGIARFGRDIGKSKPADVVGGSIYNEINRSMRPQVSGLKVLDESMSPMIAQFRQLRKDFLNADGTFKDNAVNKIATALKKPELLARMEQMSPGITTRLKLLNVIEELQKATGLHNEGLLRKFVGGQAALTGNVPLVIASILTHPTIALQIIRGFGLSKAATAEVIAQLKIMAGDTSSLRMTGTVGAQTMNENPQRP